MAKQRSRAVVRPASKAVAPGGRMQTDSLSNLLTGMGGGGDKSMFMHWLHTELDRQQIENAYRGDWVARKIIDIPAQDSTRAWRQWSADKDDITEIEKLEKQFNLRNKTKFAMSKARLYGGGALILGVAQGKPEEELVVDSVGLGDLKFVHAVSKNEITAGPIVQDIMSPYYGTPEFYERSWNAGQVRLHPSRVVRLIGLERPDVMQGDGWGDPVLQIVKDAIQAAMAVGQGVAHMVQDGKVDVIRIPELTASINDPLYEARLKKRFGLASDAKSIFNMLLLDKEEEWQRIETNFSTLPDLIRLYFLLASGAADIPATRMLSQSPAGMNATGDSDTRNHYDRISNDQMTTLSPALESLDEILVRSALGTFPDELFYTWNPLWQMTEAEQVDVDYKKAQIFKIDVDAGVLDGAVMKEARENQLIEDATYPGIESIIEEFGQPFEEPTPMLLPPGGAAALPPPPGTDPNAAPPEPDPNAAMVDRVRMVDARRRMVIRKPGGKAKGTYRMQRDRRVAVKDAKPRTLYVRRDVLNWKDLEAHFKTNGFDTTVGASMHVTLAFSRLPVDWTKAGEAWGQDEKGQLKIAPGGVRIVEKLGEAVTLLFVNSELQWRWCSIKERTGAEWTWPEYQPHITISYTGAPANIDKALPYTGPIVLGPEVFEEINEDYADLVVEDAKAMLLWGKTAPRKARKRRT